MRHSQKACYFNWCYYGTYINPLNNTRRVVFTHSFKKKTFCICKIIQDTPFISTIKYVVGSEDVTTLISHWTTNVLIDRVESDVKKAKELIYHFNQIS